MIHHAVRLMGQEHVPLWIVDDAHPDPDSLRRDALSKGFAREAGDHYPGVRSAAPDGYAAWLAGVAAEVGVRPEPQVLRTTLAIASDDAAALTPIQRIPHFDTLDPTTFAAIHYLCDAPHGGTAFYQHRRTGFERIDSKRHPNWRQALVRDAQRYGLPDRPSGRAGDTRFQVIGTAELRYNRLIFYPANCLHAGLIGEGVLSPLAATGRLTITSLLH